MNHSIARGNFPPGPNLDKEEPELANEEDIPMDDTSTSEEGSLAAPDVDPDGSKRPRDVERE